MYGSATLARSSSSTAPIARASGAVADDVLPGQSTAQQALAVRLYDTFEGAQQVWSTLENAGHGTVYQRYDWCKIWFESFQATLKAARPLILVVEMDGVPTMLLPLYTRLAVGGIRVAAFMGEKHANIRVPLTITDDTLSGRLDEVVADGSLIEAIGAVVKDHADFLTLGCMPSSYAGQKNAFFPAAKAACGDHVLVGDLHSDFEVLWRERRGNGYAKKLRKKQRALERSLEKTLCEHAEGAQTPATHVELTKVQTLDQLHAALDAFFEQKAARMKANRVENAFDLAENRDFLTRLATRSLEDGSGILDIYTLRAGDTIAGLFAGGTFAGSFSGAVNSISTDPAIVPYSPGELTLFKLIERLCADNTSTFDLGIGASRYKHGWCEAYPLRDLSRTLTALGHVYAAGHRVSNALRGLALSSTATARAARHARYHMANAIRAIVPGSSKP